MSQLHGGEIEWLVSEKYNIPIERIISFANTVSPIMSRKIHDLCLEFPRFYLYPPRNPKELMNIVAEYEKVKPENVILGSGSTELIHLFAQVYCQGKAILPIPTYGEYEEAIKCRGGRAIFVNPASGFNLNLDAIRNQLSDSRAVFVCNPNNPTGNLRSRDDMLELAHMARVENLLLFVDEAYLSFVPDSRKYSMTEFIEDYPVFVLNSLSKQYGVPSLRLGWGISSKKTIDKLSSLKIPGTIGNLAIWAAEKLLLDKQFQRKVKTLIHAEKTKFVAGLKSTSILNPYDSDCNFILSRIMKPGLTSQQLFGKLAERGIVIRDCSSIRGLGSRFVRTTVRTRADNAILITHLRGLA